MMTMEVGRRSPRRGASLSAVVALAVASLCFFFFFFFVSVTSGQAIVVGDVGMDRYGEDFVVRNESEAFLECYFSFLFLFLFLFLFFHSPVSRLSLYAVCSE